MWKTFVAISSSVEFWRVFIPAMVAIFVAAWSHQKAVTRQYEDHRKKIRTEYLMSTYKSLMIASNNPDPKERMPNLRDASISIQFLGDKSQVDEMQEIVKKVISKQTADINPLIRSIREDLRSELGLEKLDGDILWLQYVVDPAFNPSAPEVLKQFDLR